MTRWLGASRLHPCPSSPLLFSPSFFFHSHASAGGARPWSMLPDPKLCKTMADRKLATKGISQSHTVHANRRLLSWRRRPCPLLDMVQQQAAQCRELLPNQSLPGQHPNWAPHQLSWLQSPAACAPSRVLACFAAVLLLSAPLQTAAPHRSKYCRATSASCSVAETQRPVMRQQCRYPACTRAGAQHGHITCGSTLSRMTPPEGRPTPLEPAPAFTNSCSTQHATLAL